MISLTCILGYALALAIVVAASSFFYDRGRKKGFAEGFCAGKVDPRDPKTGRYVKRKKKCC